MRNVVAPEFILLTSSPTFSLSLKTDYTVKNSESNNMAHLTNHAKGLGSQKLEAKQKKYDMP